MEIISSDAALTQSQIPVVRTKPPVPAVGIAGSSVAPCLDETGLLAELALCLADLGAARFAAEEGGERVVGESLAGDESAAHLDKHLLDAPMGGEGEHQPLPI